MYYTILFILLIIMNTVLTYVHGLYQCNELLEENDEDTYIDFDFDDISWEYE